MRLWHYGIIPFLPSAQLLGQWRECCAVASRWAETGHPNHALVNPVTNYGVEEFVQYCKMVKDEMNRRGYICEEYTVCKLLSNFTKIAIRYCNEDYNEFQNRMHDIWDGREVITDIFSKWHNDTYLTICYWNMYEKFLCGCINPYEWEVMEEGGRGYV